MKNTTRAPGVAFLIICWLALAIAGQVPSAEAATVVVGSPLAGTFNTGVTFKEQPTLANTSLADPSANVTSPVSGMVVSWRMTGFYLGGPFKLRILRPVGGGTLGGESRRMRHQAYLEFGVAGAGGCMWVHWRR